MARVASVGFATAAGEGAMSETFVSIDAGRSTGAGSPESQYLEMAAESV